MPTTGSHLFLPDRLGPFPPDLRNGLWPRSTVIWIVAFWMALQMIRPWEKLVPELAAFRIERCYAVLAIAAVIGSGRLRFISCLQTTGILAWAAALTISTMFAMHVGIAWDALYVYYTIFIFYFAMMSVVRSHHELIFLVICFAAVTAMFLGKSQWEYFLYGGHAFSMGVRRLQGMNETYGHPNAVAAIAVVILPFLVFLWTQRWTITAFWPGGWRRLFPWALGLALWLSITSVLLTNSRSGMLGVVMAVMLWTLSQARFQRIFARLVVGVLLLAVIWFWMPESSKGRFRNIWDADSGPAAESAHESAQGRIAGFQAGLEMYRRFPLTGVGLANFIPYRVEQLDGVRLVAHNIVGAILGETGTLGALAFLLFVWGLFASVSATRRLAVCTGLEEVHLMEQLAIACRNSVLLILFLGMFGDLQQIAPLYWIAAFAAQAGLFARSKSLFVSADE